MYPIETLGALRIFSSAGRLDSAFTGKDAKFAASFLDGSGLVERIDKSFVRTALSPSIASVLTGFVDPHAALFAAINSGSRCVHRDIAFTELFARVGGVLAVLRGVTNILVVGGAGADTVGFR